MAGTATCWWWALHLYLPVASISPLFHRYRYVLVVGKLTLAGGALLNVEIVLHLKTLYSQRKRLRVRSASR